MRGTICLLLYTAREQVDSQSLPVNEELLLIYLLSRVAVVWRSQGTVFNNSGFYYVIDDHMVHLRFNLYSSYSKNDSFIKEKTPSGMIQTTY